MENTFLPIATNQIQGVVKKAKASQYLSGTANDGVTQAPLVITADLVNANPLPQKSVTSNPSAVTGVWQIYVFESGATHELRAISPAGTVTTIATLTP